MFTLANIFTGFNLLFGVFSIIMTFSGRLEWAVIAIFLGALCDFLDGFIARLLKQQSELGKQLDSLADMVTFGVAPGIIVFVLLILSGSWNIVQENGGTINELWIDGTFGNNVHLWTSIYFNDLVGNHSSFLPSHFHSWSKFIPFAALLIPFFSLFRLAKFNLDERQATGFIGLPTPANSLFFSSFALLLWSGFGEGDWKTSLSLILINQKILVALIILFSYLLIAEIPLFSLKFSHLKWKENEIRIIFLILTLIIILLLWVWAIPIIIILYIVLSLVNNKIFKS